MNSKKIIPVCFALDEGYIMPTTVAVSSLLQNLSEYSMVHLLFLVPDSFDEEKANILKTVVNKKNVYRSEFIRITDRRFNDKTTIEHITYPTYYRLIMAYRIPYDKVLYLDGDIIVMGDVTELYEIDIKDNYIAGVVTPYSQLRKRDKKETMERLGLDNYSLYVNAGVLLFNLFQIRKDHMEEKFLSLIDRNFPVQDQDILNSACYPKIMKLACKYNTVEEMIRYPIWELRRIYTDKDVLEARKNPVIFHFATSYKPWLYHGLLFEQQWNEAYERMFKVKLEKRSCRAPKLKSKITNVLKVFRGGGNISH